MTITLQDMLDALKGQRKSTEAIFWFCHAWHSGADSDLYRILKTVEFSPRRHAQAQIANDPEILYCFDVLGKLLTQALGHPPIEYATQAIKWDAVQENDVVIHTSPATFACIDAGWPCRVYKWNGDLGVACVEGPSGASFHPFEVTGAGFIKGFMR